MTTFDPAAKGTSIVLSNNNLTATLPSGTFCSVRSTTSRNSSSGFYFEVTWSTVTTGGGAASSIGTGNASANMSSYLSADGNSLGYNCNGGIAWNNISQGTFATWAAGDIIGALVTNATVNNTKFYKNGTQVFSGSFNFVPNYAAITLGNINDAATANYGPSVAFSPSGVGPWDSPFMFPRLKHYVRR
jgi:hypothetical protein